MNSANLQARVGGDREGCLLAYIWPESGKVKLLDGNDPMREMEKLGDQLQRAIAVGVPVELVAMLATTNHPGRLQNLFHQGSLQLLAAHRNVQTQEGITPQRSSLALAQQQRERMKALVDLIRARTWALGERKPSVEAMLKLMGHAPLPANVLRMRRAA